MTVPRVRTVFACACVCAFVPASAAPVEVERIDGSRASCGFDGASATVVHLRCPDRAAVAVDALRSIHFSRVAPGTEAPGWVELFPAAGGWFRATLPPPSSESASSGDRGSAAPGSGTESSSDGAVPAAAAASDASATSAGDAYLTVDTAFGGGLRMPLSSLAGVWLGRPDAEPKGRMVFDAALADRLPGKDVLVTQRDGEVATVRGRVVALGAEGGRIVLGRRERSFGLHRVLGIVFATGLPSGERWPVTVHLADGTEFAGRLIDADASRIRFQASFGAEVAVGLDGVSWLRFDSDRLVYVSALEPVGESSSGLLHAALPARFDRSVANGPLLVGGRRFERGIGVHAASRLEYAVSGAYQTFAADIGIDDSVRPRGDVVFRVEGDGRTLFDSGPVTGRDAARAITVDVTGVSTLALIVDYGADLDLSDRAIWGDARLIKPPDDGAAR